MAADALVLAIPEYNHGPSGHAKDAIDWVSRPYGRHQLRDKAIAVMSSGESGGGRHMQAWLVPILASLGNTMVVEPTIAVVNGSDRIATRRSARRRARRPRAHADAGAARRVGGPWVR